MNRFTRNLCEKRILFLKHQKKQNVHLQSGSRSRSQSQSSSGSIAISPSVSSTADIHSMRSHHANRLSDYQWWTVTPWTELFVIVKLAASRFTTIDISARIFLSILGVFDDSENTPFLGDSESQSPDEHRDVDSKLGLEFDSKIAFLPKYPDLMESVIAEFAVFIGAEFHSESTIKLMILKAIYNALSEMEYFRSVVGKPLKPNGADSVRYGML